MLSQTVENNIFLKCFKDLNITTTEKDIDEFVGIDNEINHVFHERILEEGNIFLKNSN